MDDKEIKIGALYPLTGMNKYAGETIRQALEFYVDLVNNQKQEYQPCLLKLPYLGKRKIKLIWADTQGDPIIGFKEARRLIECEGVTSIIGSYQTAVTSAVSFLTEVFKVPYVSPDTDGGILSKRGLKYFFKVGTDDITYTKSLFKMMQEKGLLGLGLGSLDENTLLGQGEVEYLIRLAYKYKYDVSTVELYNPEFSDVKSNLLKMRCYNPGVIFAGQLSNDAIKTINALKSINYYPMAMFDQTSEYTLKNFLDAVDKDADYVVSAVPWSIGVTKILPLAKEVNCMYKSVYGEDLNTLNSASFTGLYVLIDAISRATHNTPEAIRRALVETDIPSDRLIMPWCGVRFNEEGKNIFASSFVVQIFNKKLKIVWPKELAETNLVFPAPPWCCR